MKPPVRINERALAIQRDKMLARLKSDLARETAATALRAAIKADRRRVERERV
jgi:hypothetical protein